MTRRNQRKKPTRVEALPRLMVNTEVKMNSDLDNIASPVFASKKKSRSRRSKICSKTFNFSKTDDGVNPLAEYMSVIENENDLI